MPGSGHWGPMFFVKPQPVPVPHRVAKYHPAIKTFLAAVKATLGSTENGHTTAGEALEAAENALDRRDPTADPDRLVPVIDEPKPEDLKPFLTGWNPYGPESRYG